jgi:hypothetical protein
VTRERFVSHFAAVDACSHYKRFVPPVLLAIVVAAVGQIVGVA